LQVDIAEISLVGAREENQDRVAAAVNEDSALLVAVDGMGGHAHGARAAEVAQKSILDAFRSVAYPIFDPLGFMHVTLGRAHAEVVKLGRSLPLEKRPRATCAVCLVQQGSTYWAHIGDSRIYLLRAGQVVNRTRDHSHVEIMVRDGLITNEQALTHPMRNFVECCLGGDPMLPDMSISGRCALQPNDVLLVCTDGLWTGVRDAEIAAALGPREAPLPEALGRLGHRAVAANGSGADNTSAVALRWRS
jgi:serine/threonine protein phosphatase PrpC